MYIRIMTRLLLILLLLVNTAVAAFDKAVINSIDIRGMERIDRATVMDYLPLAVGETIDQQRSSEIINALYKTGFFDDIELRLDEEKGALLIYVKERPAIASLKISGVDDNDVTLIKDSLKNIDLAEGKIFNRTSLSMAERSLRELFLSRSLYSVDIKSTVSATDDGRVDIFIEVTEGGKALIKKINIVGNNQFLQDQLTARMQLTPKPGLFSDNDQYSQIKLGADLEAIRTYYLDNGYIDFSIVSTQVTITPDKKDVYITININEGSRYSVDTIEVTGDLVGSAEQINELITLQPGDIFSRKMVTESSAAISRLLGEKGYAFANVNAVPRIDKNLNTIGLTYVIDPGKRVYVRRINITGNLKTLDEVIRREFRQMEGGWLSTEKINRSRIRLQRLGFFDDVNIETPAVAGTDDQVDINVSLTERPSGSLMAGIGYAQTQGFLINASVSQNNFLGTGRQLSANINNSAVTDVYSFSFTEPYYTLEGVSRGFKVFYSKTDAGKANVSDYTTDVFGGSLSYGIPLNEYDRASLSLGYENTQIKDSLLTPQSILNFLNANSDQFDIIKLTTSWSHDTRNRAIFADSGMIFSISGEMALPGSGLEFYKINMKGQQYIPLGYDFVFQLKGDMGYGESYGDTTEYPFFENYYAGGAHSVRGYRGNSLGPLENGNPSGGAFKIIGNAELIFPLPLSESGKNFQLSAFVDGGNVFKSIDTVTDKQIRYSAGISAIWMTPVAPLTFSYSWPINDKPGDELERFQFTLGAFFF